MFMGTERVAGSDFDNIMEAGGGWNNATTSEDRTNYYSMGPSELLPTLLWLEADRLEDLGADGWARRFEVGLERLGQRAPLDAGVRKDCAQGARVEFGLAEDAERSGLDVRLGCRMWGLASGET